MPLPATTYLAQISPCACTCNSPKKQLFQSKSLERAISAANAHWLIYLTWYGDLTHWADIIVVDSRDGVIEWMNGKPTRSVENGNRQNEDDRDGNGRDSGRDSRWLF